MTINSAFRPFGVGNHVPACLLGVRQCWPGWLLIYQDGLPTVCWCSPIQVL